jgi:hypothetical protein
MGARGQVPPGMSCLAGASGVVGRTSAVAGDMGESHV